MAKKKKPSVKIKLKNYVKKVPSQKKSKSKKVTTKSTKKVVRKTRTRVKGDDRGKQNKRQKDLLPKKKLRKKKSVRKTRSKNTISVQSERGSRGGKKVKRIVSKPAGKSFAKILGKLESKKSYRENYSQVDFKFSKVHKADKKILLFKSKSTDTIKNALKRKGGKPPRGIIVTVRDKSGREKTEMSRFDFVVNQESTKNFVGDMLERMKDDFMEWTEMIEENGGVPDGDENPYGDYNPDDIKEISVKFIY